MSGDNRSKMIFVVFFSDFQEAGSFREKIWLLPLFVKWGRKDQWNSPGLAFVPLHGFSVPQSKASCMIVNSVPQARFSRAVGIVGLL